MIDIHFLDCHFNMIEHGYHHLNVKRHDMNFPKCQHDMISRRRGAEAAALRWGNNPNLVIFSILYNPVWSPRF